MQSEMQVDSESVDVVRAEVQDGCRDSVRSRYERSGEEGFGDFFVPDFDLLA